MKRLKISIITPSYNQGKFIEQTILSVVNQKGSFELEYLIMDGGSTDNSVQIIKKYAQKYPQVYWQSKPDRGQVDAINQGLKLATGNIVAYINSDDYYLPGTFKKVISYFDSNPEKKWIVGDCRITKKSLKWTFFLKHLSPIERSRFILECFNTINQPAVFLTKSLVKKVGNFNEDFQYAFDYEYWLRASKIALPGRIHNDLTVFRVHKQAKGSIDFEKQFSEDLVVAKSQHCHPLSLAIHHIAKSITTSLYRFVK